MKNKILFLAILSFGSILSGDKKIEVITGQVCEQCSNCYHDVTTQFNLIVDKNFTDAQKIEALRKAWLDYGRTNNLYRYSVGKTSDNAPIIRAFRSLIKIIR